MPAAYDLNGQWTLAYGSADAPDDPAAAQVQDWPSLPARVPGSIADDLVAAGLTPETRIGDGAWRLRPWESKAWWYRRAFDVSGLGTQRWQLVFDGLDCLASIWLNGRLLGRTDNALIPHRLECSSQLRQGRNELAIRLAAAVPAGRLRTPELGEFHPHAFGWESLAIRKPGHQYGWDILPRLTLGGVHRGVRLEALAPSRIRDCSWSTISCSQDGAEARLLVCWDAEIAQDAIGSWRVRLSLTQDGETAWSQESFLASSHGRAIATVPRARLWWPRGWGAASLYQARVELIDADGASCHEQVREIGIRTIELRRTEPGAGASADFCLIVNGERLFARGTNWVPLDALHARDGDFRAQALQLLWESGSNLVRMWGGGIYEDDEVYAWCDRHGVLVWQDFALACAIYPQSDEFAAAISAEASAVIRRLRHHPSLALWCGGNETDSAHQWAGIGQDPGRDRLSRQVLPEQVQRHDPLRPYLASSPIVTPGTLAGGVAVEDHLWGPRDDWLGSYYQHSQAVFVSEIGWHGCPDPASLAAMQPPGAELWPIEGNERWLPQAVCAVAEDRAHAGRLSLIARQAELVTCDPLATLDDFAFASQVSQAEALKCFIERARVRKGRMWGLLWWNLRDGWPVISDAVVDYFGRRKLAFAVVARAQADVAVIVALPEAGAHAVVVVNDRLVAVTLHVSISDEHGRVLLEQSCTVAANEVDTLAALPESRDGALWIVRWSGDATGASHVLAGRRPWPLAALRRWYERIADLGVGQRAAVGRPLEGSAHLR